MTRAQLQQIYIPTLRFRQVLTPQEQNEKEPVEGLSKYLNKNFVFVHK